MNLASVYRIKGRTAVIPGVVELRAADSGTCPNARLHELPLTNLISTHSVRQSSSDGRTKAISKRQLPPIVISVAHKQHQPQGMQNKRCITPPKSLTLCCHTWSREVIFCLCTKQHSANLQALPLCKYLLTKPPPRMNAKRNNQFTRARQDGKGNDTIDGGRPGRPGALIGKMRIGLLL